MLVEKDCAHCRKKFSIQHSSVVHGRGKYCGKKCFYEAKSEAMTGKRPAFMWGRPSKPKEE